MKLKNLPVGISDFRIIRESNYLYIDKTEYIYNLINTGMYYFLSRPRRFGKSLLISTFNEIFLGNRELFKGLWIYESDYEWKKYSVLRFDFNTMSNDSPEILKKSLKNKLNNIGEKYEVKIDNSGLLKEMFIDVIEKIYQKMGEKIVFLIDEYDKPIIDHLGKGDEHLNIAKENRDLLKSFYGTLKAQEVVGKTRFVFLTGVTKFSKVSIFSELNNLIDITMDGNYSAILGVTEEEVKKFLFHYMENFCEEEGINFEDIFKELKSYYNGYRFSKKNVKVYNPFSLFLALRGKEIKNYWFETGTPTFLVNLIKDKGVYIPKYEEFEVEEYMFSTFELENIDPLPVMFQTGYLTIKDYSEDLKLYKLSYPNREVRESFAKYLFREVTGLVYNTKYKQVGDSIVKGDIDRAIEIIKGIFSEIPYPLLGRNLINETYFETVFYLILTASGVMTETEVLGYRGRIDILVETPTTYYIFEFKCNQSAEKGIEQILRKKYYEPYLSRGKKIFLVGINFKTDKKNIEEFKVKEVSLDL